MAYMMRKEPEQRRPGLPFMMTVKQSAQEAPDKQEFWFTKGRMGKNKIAQLLPDACTEVGIDVKAERYKTTSGRKMLMEGGVESAVPGVILSKVAGHSNLNSLNHYVRGKEASHNAASIVMSRKMGAKKVPNFEEVYKELQDVRAVERRARGLTGHYMGKAIGVDQNYGGVRPGEVGRVQRKLETFGDVRGLVFGAFRGGFRGST